jgi:hypothetical protein
MHIKRGFECYKHLIGKMVKKIYIWLINPLIRLFIIGIFLNILVTEIGELYSQNLPLGGRTASMGGAGMAFGRDSAMPYLNPAGLARIPHHTFSLSANLYTQEARRDNEII